LNFVQAGNIDSNTTVGSIGYNYALTRNDTIGLVYRFSAFHFPGSPQAYGDHAVNIAYARKITGRLGLRLFVGPEFTFYRIPVGTTTQSTGVSITANLTYGFERGSLGLSYIHGLSAGSGVFIGSNLDQVTTSVNRSLTRHWSGNVNFGYARNSPIGGTGLAGVPAYDDWFAGGGLSRPIGRNFNFGLAYTATIANNSAAGCTGVGCNTTYHTVTINFQWHTRPFVLR
jgi:hypothetical protein